MKNVVAQKLIACRGQRRREEVAKAVGVSLSAIVMYEYGHRVPRDEIKRKLAEYYNVTVDELFFSNQPNEL